MRFLLIAAALLGGAVSAQAADKVAWIGTVSLPALLERAPATEPRLDASLPAACLPGNDRQIKALLESAAQADTRLRVAEQFFATLAAEDEENLGTEKVAASYGLFTHQAPDAQRELAYREALSRRNAARLEHQLARLRLGQLTAADKGVGEALDTEALAWPAAPAADPQRLLLRVLAGNPRLQAVTLLLGRGGVGSCRVDLRRLATELRHKLSLATLASHGRLELALDGQRSAAELQLEIAETRLDEVRAELKSSHDLHAAQIATAQALSALNRVRDAALLAAMQLQALTGERPAPALQPSR
jgi:hypothetical protein